MSNLKGSFSIYSDGGARGNPGPAAIAFIVLSPSGELLKTWSSYVGVRTNNQAEYEALIAALTKVADYNARVVVCYLDSQLVCRQLTGVYSVKNSDLRILWERVQELKKRFGCVDFENVPRTDKHIKMADKLVNAALDSRLK